VVHHRWHPLDDVFEWLSKIGGNGLIWLASPLRSRVPRAAPAFYVLAVAIGYSRVYVGVHWPLDVVGGAVLGISTALLLLAVTRRRSVRLRR
jgi:membrane-associated phospholipid phosphatase